MNISEQEFIAVVDDTLGAMGKNGLASEVKQEVLSILYALKEQFVRV